MEAQAQREAASSTAKRLPATSRWLRPKWRRFAALATKDPRDRLARRVPPERTAKMETMERTETTARTPKCCRHPSRSHALSAHLDRQDPKARLDRRDRPDQKARPESRHVTECPANRECKASLARLDAPDVRDHAEHPANPVVSSQCQDHKDQLAPLDQPESKAPRDSPAPTDNPSKDLPARPEMLADLDVRDVPEDPAPLDHPARTARRAPATIAPSRGLRPATSPKPEAAVAVPDPTATERRKCRSIGPHQQQQQQQICFCGAKKSKGIFKKTSIALKTGRLPSVCQQHQQSSAH